jgi:hypothetical protein
MWRIRAALVTVSLLAVALSTSPAQANQASPRSRPESGPRGVAGAQPRFDSNQAVPNAVPDVVPGDGNACLDNTVINNANGILKIKMCVGYNGSDIYSFSHWRCGKPGGQPGYQTCSFGVHEQYLRFVEFGWAFAELDTQAFNVQTRIFRGPPLCTGIPGTRLGGTFQSRIGPLDPGDPGVAVTWQNGVRENLHTARSNSVSFTKQC